jgi:hypothetical protein
MRHEEADVIRRSFVGEVGTARKRIVHREPLFGREDRAQDPLGRVRLEDAVEHRGEIGGNEMEPSVRAVGRRNAGCRVRGPHRGRARAEPERVVARHGIARRLREDLLLAAVEPELLQRGEPGSLVRRKDGLAHAERSDEPHLGEALQRGTPRIGNLSAVRHRGDVARREAGIVVRRSDDAVEIVLAHARWLLARRTLPRSRRLRSGTGTPSSPRSAAPAHDGAARSGRSTRPRRRSRRGHAVDYRRRPARDLHSHGFVTYRTGRRSPPRRPASSLPRSRRSRR